MDLLWVRCTLEHYDTTSVKNFNGSLYVDTSDKSFKVICGGGVEHKFYANEFNRLGKPPSKSTAKQFALEFNVSKQLPARHHIRKRKLVFRVAELSQRIRDVYDELAKIFPRGASPDQNSAPEVTSPVGMLRSRPENGNQSVAISRPLSFVNEKPRQNKTVRPGGTSTSSLKARSRTSQRSQQSINMDKHSKNDCSGSAGLKENRAEISRENDVGEPSTSTKPVMVDPRDTFKQTHQKQLKYGVWSGSKNVATKDEMVLPDEAATKANSSELGTQGSVIALMEKKSLESCAIKVTAPFTPRPHTCPHGKCFRAKRLAYDFSQDQRADDDFANFDDFNSASFYGSSRTLSNRKSLQPRRPGDIISPRPQLLTDSVSSSRCLMSPVSRNKDSVESSQHISSYRGAMTPTRKRKEIEKVEDSVSTVSVPSTSSEQPSPYSYRGLENLTNSCYMNATLQALASVFPFYYRMQVIQQRYEEGYECSEFVRRFNDVLQNLVSPDRVLDSKYGSATKISVLEALRTAAGKELGSDPDFGSNVQQDAHEFLAKTLEILEKEALRLKKFNRSIDGQRTNRAPECSTSPRSVNRNPAGVFQHKIRNRINCERCASTSENTDDAIDLTVTLKAGQSIQRMIENALARDPVEYNCATCGKGSGFVSRAFATLPQSLIVVVKRYRFGEGGGSKIDERVGVSRELFLKDLCIDSEMKRQEGKARQSVTQSVSPFAGSKPNGHSSEMALSKDSAAVVKENEIPFVPRSDIKTAGEPSLVAVEHENGDDCLILETARSPENTEKYPTAQRMPPEKVGMSTPGSSNITEMPSYMRSRAALSPLKMNRPRLAVLEKVADPIRSPRKLNACDIAVDAVATPLSSGAQEKENVIHTPLSNASFGTDSSIVQQSGGYLNEDLSDSDKVPFSERAAPSVENHTAFGSTSHQSIPQYSARSEDTLQVDDHEDVPRKRSRVEDVAEVKDSINASTASSKPNESLARLITEPLRPFSRPSSNRGAEVLQTPEQISVLGEYEERNTLFFRPVTEECQKSWCMQLGFRYTGSPELRKRTFGQEVAFSLRDMPLSCEVRGDGNCLFRTLCWWVTGGNEKDHFKLREKLVTFMSQHCSKFASLLPSQQDMETHLQKMSEDGEWGTQVELAAAACYLGVNIYTFLEGKWLKYRPLFRWSTSGSPPKHLHRDECNDDRGAIFICNASGCHFQPAVSVEQSSSRRNLRPRKDVREIRKDLNSPARTPEPPYVFNAADGPVYSLAAVICHHGDSLLSGHYSTFSLDATRREWLDCNDSTITKVGIEYLVLCYYSRKLNCFAYFIIAMIA
ncbi:hypothetical protein GCK32_006858 [Trichostrongylus colubriformis]|uniref:Uncharacterized protein n=1 Tax=Trichostrongylus colubriformis TaxID=6319 RepID=A0AAN8FGL4_TRICO